MRHRIFALILLAASCWLPGPVRGQNIAWPLAPQNQEHKIWNTYGELSGNTDGTGNHFHEATDLPADSGTAVLAAVGGIVVEVYTNPMPYYNFITIGVPPLPCATGWFYCHVHLGHHPRTGVTWAVNDTVRAGDTVGWISKWPGTAMLPHLHFQAVNNANGGFHANGYPLADVNGNPIEYLNPRNDDVPPTITLPLLYRPAGGERVTGTRYFDTKTASGIVVAAGNVDMVARAWDRFRNFAGTNYDLNVRKIEFAVNPAKYGGAIPYTSSASFTGLFVKADAPAGRNAYDKLRDSARTSVVYEDDNTARSTFHRTDGTAGSALYYILTNVDDDADLEMADSSRYWDTNGKKGDSWNDNDETAAHEAADNADAAFPDGKYAVTVRVTGQADAAAVTATDTVFINNADETVVTCDQAGREKFKFQQGKPVYAKGSGFPANASFTLYVVKNTTWSHGMGIPAGGDQIAAVVVTADNKGEIAPVQVWASYAPNGDPDAGYDVIVDFDGDGKFSDTREGHVVDPILDNKVDAAGFKEAKVDVAFIIDDTGSMGEEIAGVRQALLDHLAGYNEASGTSFQLVTFKDGVSPRDPTDSLKLIQQQVGALVASGGGDCPESSVEAVNLARGGMTEKSRAFVATDASPHPGLNLDDAISALRSAGIRVDVLCSGDCPVTEEGVARAASANSAAAPRGPAKPVPVVDPRILNFPRPIDNLKLTIDTLKLYDDDYKEVVLPFPFAFGGHSYTTVFVSSNGCITFGKGDYSSGGSASALVAGPRRIAGQWRDLNPGAGGTVTFRQTATDVQIGYDSIRQYSGTAMTSFAIKLRNDNSFAVLFGPGSIVDGLTGFSIGHSVGDPGKSDLSGLPQPITGGVSGTVYEVFSSGFDLAGKTLEFAPVTAVPPKSYSAIEAFSLMARQTGGIFSYLPEVNSSDSTDRQRFQNAAFNIVQGGITRSIALADPPAVSPGGRVRVLFKGSGTNFAPGTTLSFSGAGITSSNISVRSPIEIEADVQVAGSAATGFRDVRAMTNLGSGVIDSAAGHGVLLVKAASTAATVAGVSPSSGAAGQSLTVVVYGLNTHFAAASTLSMGTGITVQSVNAVSATELHAAVVISSAAAVGFRDVTVTTGAETANENVTGPFFVALQSPNMPEILSATPPSGRPGATLRITVHGRFTSFTAGQTAVTFSGTGVGVLSVSVLDTVSASVQIRIAPDAGPGYRDIRVTTGSESAVLLNGFLVSTNVPAMVLAQSTIAFGAVAARSAHQATVLVKDADTAGAALVVDSLVITGTDAAEFSAAGATLPAAINPGDSLALPIRFSPVTLGQKSAVLRLVTNDPSHPATPLALSGEGSITLTAAILQNPGASRFADIVVISDVPLQKLPSVTIGISPDSTVLALKAVGGSSGTFGGPYEFRTAGTYTVRTASLDSGLAVSRTRTFNSALSRPGSPVVLASYDGQARLEIPAGALVAETFLIADPGGAGERGTWEFGPRLALGRPAIIDIGYDPAVQTTPAKLFIYAEEGGGWRRLPSQVLSASRRVRARTSVLGGFRVAMDLAFEGNNILPTAWALRQNYPNPFNPATTIEYDQPADGPVQLIVYDLLGRAVRTLVDEGQTAGSHAVIWDGTARGGLPVASGVYLYRLQAGGFTQTRRLIILR